MAFRVEHEQDIETSVALRVFQAVPYHLEDVVVVNTLGYLETSAEIERVLLLPEPNSLRGEPNGSRSLRCIPISTEGG